MHITVSANIEENIDDSISWSGGTKNSLQFRVSSIAYWQDDSTYNSDRGKQQKIFQNSLNYNLHIAVGSGSYFFLLSWHCPSDDCFLLIYVPFGGLMLHVTKKAPLVQCLNGQSFMISFLVVARISSQIVCQEFYFKHSSLSSLSNYVGASLITYWLVKIETSSLLIGTIQVIHLRFSQSFMSLLMLFFLRTSLEWDWGRFPISVCCVRVLIYCNWVYHPNYRFSYCNTFTNSLGVD